MKILIPMAGHSRRFKNSGFEGHKALLQVGKNKMINHVVDMFSEDDEFTFIINEKHLTQNVNIYEFLKNIRIWSSNIKSLIFSNKTTF